MELGLLVLRGTVGLLFIGHGAQKLFSWFGGDGPDGTAQLFESAGLRPGRALAYAAGAAEILGGLSITLGLLTPAGGALLTAVMLTAVWTVHRANGLWITNGGFEYNLVLVAALFALSAVGAGAWSLDHALGLDLAGTGWALAELAAGLAGAVLAVASGRLTRREPGTARPVGA
jgi:putative oxidoreductase